MSSIYYWGNEDERWEVKQQKKGLKVDIISNKNDYAIANDMSLGTASFIVELFNKNQLENKENTDSA